MQHLVTIESLVELPSPVSEASVLSLLTHVLRAEGMDEAWELGLQLVDDATMQAAHVEFMDIDEPTDIMTFPYADDDDVWGDSGPGGDLMISVDRARANAIDADWQVEEELFFLVTHGILHLLGWDDHTEDDRARMLARQHALMQSWDRVI